MKIHYRVIQAESTTELEKMVQKSLDSGWGLAGGVSVSVVVHNEDGTQNWANTDIIFVQALTRRYLG